MFACTPSYLLCHLPRTLHARQPRLGGTLSIVHIPHFMDERGKMVSAARAVGLIFLCAMWLGVVMPLPAQTGALAVKITGQSPYDYAVLRATELSLAQAPWQDLQHPYRVMGVKLPALQGEWKEAWATALLQTQHDADVETRELPVRVSYVGMSELSPAKLLVSNVPEKILTPRVLCEGSVSPEQPARLLFHHVNYTSATMAFSVELLNTSLLSAQVQVVDAVAGPSLEESEVGHQAAFTFLNRLARNSGYIVRIPPSSAVIISNTIFPPRNIVSGLAQFRVLTSTPLIVRVRVHATGSGSGVSTLLNYSPSSIYGDFEYLTTHIYYHGSYTVGGDWLFMPLGELSTPAVRPGQNLGGSYGVTHKYALTARNPTSHAVSIALLVEAAGGTGRLIYSVDERWHETETLRPRENVTLLRFSLPAGGSRVINLRAIPEAGSNYPMRFIMRSVE